MTNKDKKEEIAEYYSNLILLQYAKNKPLVKDIILWLVENYDFDIAHWFDIDKATGEHLDILADTLFNLSRNYNGYTFTDQELQLLCRIKMIKNSCNCFNNNVLLTAYRLIFQRANVTFSANGDGDLFISVPEDTYHSEIIKYVIENNLLIIPICTTLYLSFIPSKTIYFPLCDGYYGEMYAPPSLVDDELPYAKWSNLDKTDIIIRQLESDH